MSCRQQFSLRATLAVIGVIALVLATLMAWFRWANREVPEIEQTIALWGMPTVYAIDAYRRQFGRVPLNLEEAHVGTPLTPYGYLTYQLYGTFGGDYDLYVYLGAHGGYLRWDDSSRCWVTHGRSPYELRWTELQAQELIKAVDAAPLDSETSKRGRS